MRLGRLLRLYLAIFSAKRKGAWLAHTKATAMNQKKLFALQESCLLHAATLATRRFLKRKNKIFIPLKKRRVARVAASSGAIFP